MRLNERVEIEKKYEKNSCLVRMENTLLELIGI